MIRIAIVADIHHGAPSFSKRGDAALRLMGDFAEFVKQSGASHVLDLGDRISDMDRDTDLRLEAEVAEAFRAVPAKVLHLNGNHDRDFLTVAENEAIFGQPMGHRIVDIEGWRIILWAADTRIVDHSFSLMESDLLWLTHAMANADRPVLLASHVPLSGHAQTGNYWFENNAGVATYPMLHRVRAALAMARVPVTCIAGHVHWNTITTVDGITHLTQQSLTESFTTGGEPAGAMGLLELDDQVRWTVSGGDPIAATFRPTAGRWVPPMPKFTEIREV